MRGARILKVLLAEISATDGAAVRLVREQPISVRLRGESR